MKKEEEEGNFFSREGNESETRQSRSMKFEKESIFMQILKEKKKRRKKKERERDRKIRVGNLFTNQGNRKQSVKVDGK